MKVLERALTSVRELAHTPARLAALDQMNTPELVALYRELYGEPTRTRNATYLRKRLGFRLQELEHGGLPASALQKIAELGDQMPERWRIRLAQQEAGEPPPQPAHPRDPRLPPVGTILRRVHNGIEHEVRVCADGFEHAGTRFKSLSAVAKHITGTPWNGFLFFRVARGSRHTATQEERR
jgi:hypothetical protein